MGDKFCNSVLRKMEDGELYESRMVVVTDDWYPCFLDNRVCMAISVHKNFGKKYVVRIAVFGEDDFGVELSYTSEHPNVVYNLYNHWKKYIFDRVPDGVDLKWFYEHGFFNS